MERFIVANGTALRISDTAGNGPALVFLHGYLESLDVWDEFSERFTPDCRIVAVDLPGHGISEVKGAVHTMEFMADTVKGVLDKLEIGRCFLIGHSMGGYVAEAFAAAWPEMLEGLVLFHATPNPDSENKKEDRRREISLVKAAKKELIAELFASKGFAPENRLRLHDAVERQRERIAMTEEEGITAVLEGLIRRKDQNEMLRALDVPQLFVFGKIDEFISEETARTIAAAHPRAETVWLEHSGHMGFLEEPETAATILKTFIEKHKDK